MEPHIQRDGERFGCKRHRPFYDEGCSACWQADIHWHRKKNGVVTPPELEQDQKNLKEQK